MNSKKNETDSFSGLSSDTNIYINQKDIDLNKKFIIKKKLSMPKPKKKKVKFKSRFTTVINIESYKKYNGDNIEQNKQNFSIPKYKQTYCSCSIY